MAMNSNFSQTWDHSSGQDAAYKAAQERSNLQAQGQSSLYGGDISGMLASTSRIRDLQKYLSAYGSDPNGLEVIPRSRLAQTHYATSQSYDDV